jgi:O-antigen/teichoic acid export membrane protein
MLNIFFGPAVNAAKGLANSVNMMLQSFGNNFKQALIPQITKSYAANDTVFMWSLFERGTRITYFLFLVFSVPVLLETEFILKLWLGNVPEYTAIFTKLMIIDILTWTVISGLWNIANASGRLKELYIVSYISSLLVLVLSYVVCKIGYPPQYMLAVLPLIRLLFYPVNLILAKKLFNLSLRFFAKKAIIPMFFVSIISFFPFYFINNVFLESFIRSFVIIITSMLWTGIVIMFIGLRKNERVQIFNFVKRRIK